MHEAFDIAGDVASVLAVLLAIPTAIAAVTRRHPRRRSVEDRRVDNVDNTTANDDSSPVDGLGQGMLGGE